MKKDLSHLVGISGQAEIVEVYAAVTNTDLNDPNYGDEINDSYHLTEESARAAAVGIGVMGSTGKVQKRLAARFDDDLLFILAVHGSPLPAEGAPEIFFKNKKPIEWAREHGIIIIDSDGWRDDGKSFDEPISLHEFRARAILSTMKRVGTRE